MSNSYQGVDLSLGKLLLPLTLASVSGPNNFGDELKIQYATLGLLSSIRNWNQDSFTGVVGLGWTLTLPAITRIGIGSINDKFLLNGIVLLVKTKTSDGNGGYILTFETANHSLTQITYTSSNETWTIIDDSGVQYIYGGTNNNAIAWGVRWVSNDIDNSPASWIGATTVTNTQQNFALIWYLAVKINPYGQQISYTYHHELQNIGEDNAGLGYTLASYLTGINVLNGDSIVLHYQSKKAWEYPTPRWRLEGSGTRTNAYQDRFETQYLSSITLYNESNTLVQQTQLEYAFLWENFGSAIIASEDYHKINKRILLAVRMIAPDSQPLLPKYKFDYWGYKGINNDGYKQYFDNNLSLLRITNDDLDGSSFNLAPFRDKNNNTYYQLFGHLKNFTSPNGAKTWYSYREIAKNYGEIWGDFDNVWSNRLDLKNVRYPDGKEGDTSIWNDPRPFWGADGFIVLRFYSKHTIDGYYRIHLDIYEWLGSWQKVIIENFPDKLAVSNYSYTESKDYNFIVTGTGLFGLVRTDIKDPDYGSIALFNRHRYLPGQWQASYFAVYTKINYGKNSLAIPTDINLPESNFQITSAQVSMGAKVVGVLDRVNGQLYIMGWNGTSWNFLNQLIAADPDSVVLGMVAVDINVLVIANAYQYDTNNSHPTYSLASYFPYELTTPWQLTQGQLNHIRFVEAPGRYHFFIKNFYLSIGNGFITLNALMYKTESLKNNANPASSNFYRSLILSWDDNNNIYAQCLMNGNSWSFEGHEYMQLPWKGSGQFQEVANNIFYTEARQKIAFTFTGGNTIVDEYKNPGWFGYKFDNNIANDDYWGNLPLMDATVEAKGTSNISYQFYQYDPATLSWQLMTILSHNLGNQTDWQVIEAIVLFTINQILNLISILAPLAQFSVVLQGALTISEAAMPISAIASRIIGTAAEFFISEAAGNVASTFTGLIAGQVDNALQNYVLNSVFKSLFSGYANNQLGQYILVGHQWEIPKTFFKKWVPTDLNNLANLNNNFYEWVSLDIIEPDRPLYPLYPEDKANCGLSMDSFIMADNFIAYDFGIETHEVSYYYISTGQVTFFQNGIILSNIRLPLTDIPEQYKAKYSKFAVYENHDGVFSPVSQIAYQLGSKEKASSEYGYPLLAAPWGGLLGFLGKLNFSNSQVYQSGIEYALSFGLFMAQDGSVEGAVRDYVVNKIGIDDGYQIYFTHFQYMPQQAAFDKNINSIRYNQVRVSQGEWGYIASVMANGWKEYYFYNGGLFYSNSPWGNLPYDPASPNSSDPSYSFLSGNATQTNLSEYYNLATGQLYCYRNLQYLLDNHFVSGNEIKRLWNFYSGFEKPIYDSDGNVVGNQKTMGSLLTLSVNLIGQNVISGSIDNTNIFAAYNANAATLDYTYYFYDLTGFYSPWTPSDSSKPYNLWSNFISFKQGLQSALLLATLRFNYNYDITQQKISSIEGFYQQQLPGLLADVQMGGENYHTFLDKNWYSVTIQTTTWHHPNLTFSVGEFPNPTGAWENTTDWQIVSVNTNTWTHYDVGNQRIWHLDDTYQWVSNSQGDAQTTQFSFPWGDPPKNDKANVDWIKKSKVAQISNLGVTINKEDSVGTPYLSIYDQNNVNVIAEISNAFSYGGPAFYIGFEVYENLANWSLAISELSNTQSMMFATQTYSGYRSLSLTSNAAASSTYYLSYQLSVPTVLDNRDWLLAFTVYNTLSVGSYDVSVYANDLNNLLLSQTVSSTGSFLWQSNYFTISNFGKQINGELTTLIIEFSIDEGYGSIYIDNITLIPLQESNFIFNVYNPSTMQKVAWASVNDRNFNSRIIYDNHDKPIGTIRLTDQPDQAASIVLTANYLSRDGNEDEFQQKVPNRQLVIQAGINQAFAGNYFTFRNATNPWIVDMLTATQQDGLLLLSSGKTATYPLPTIANYGIGIRAQLSGYVAEYEVSLNSGSSVGMPVPATTDPSLLWGVSAQQTESGNNLFAFDINGSGQLTQQTTLSLSSTNPVATAESKVLVANSANRLFGAFEYNNGNYGLFNFLNRRAKLIYSNVTTSLYPPIGAFNNILYFADDTNSLYAVDVTYVDQLNSTAFDVKQLIVYSNILANSRCPTSPIAGGIANNQIVFSLVDSASNTSTIVKYFIDSNYSISLSSNLTDNIALSPAIDTLGNVFVIGNNTLYSFNNALSTINTVDFQYTNAVVGSPIASNGIFIVALSWGWLMFFDKNLTLLNTAYVPVKSILQTPVVNGQLISFSAIDNNSNYTILTYTMSGKLATAPFIISDTTALLTQSLSEFENSLSVMQNNYTFYKLTLAVPSASISLGDYKVTWDAQNKQYTLSGPNINTETKQGRATYGDWLLMWVNPKLYFFADGEQIFAIDLDLTSLPSGNFSITATDSAISCRDIVTFVDQSLSVRHLDGEMKVRQQLQLADVVNPQS